MKFTFIRHGQTDSNKRNILIGWQNPPLDSEGEAQIQSLSKIVKHDFDVIYSSTLIRANQTADILNKTLNLPLYTDERLKERSFGMLENKSWVEIEKIVGEDLQANDLHFHYNYHDFGGESVEDVKERLGDFIDEVKASKYKKPLVVAHAGVIRLLYNVTEKESPVIENGSVHEFEL